MFQSMRFLIVSTLTDLRNSVILVGHWLLHAYGIVSITQFKDPVFHGAFVALVPLPAVFYVLTARFTDPNKVHTDWTHCELVTLSALFKYTKSLT